MIRADNQRIVITGVGVVSPNGLGAGDFADALIAGRSGLKRIEFDPSLRLKTSAVGSVEIDLDSILPPGELRRVPRMVPLALAASREAFSWAKIDIDSLDLETSRSIAVALGSGGGGLAFVEEQYRRYFLDGRPSLFAITAGTHGNLSSELSIQLGLRGTSQLISTGCTSSTDAIGLAIMLIRTGRSRFVLAGGADAPIAPGIIAAFEQLGVISTRRYDDPAESSRPFDVDHDGFVLSEGAWMFVLESLESAKSRGATVFAEILGFGSTCDAFHRVRIAPDVVECSRAIQLALDDAQLTPTDIEYVNLHGTGTQLNDTLETAAMHQSLGEHARFVPMSSTKSLAGHPQGASGAMGLAATVLTLRRGRLHPTINLTTPADGCDLDYIPNNSRDTRATLALCNCIAFGSKNSAMIVKVNPCPNQ